MQGLVFIKLLSFNVSADDHVIVVRDLNGRENGMDQGVDHDDGGGAVRVSVNGGGGGSDRSAKELREQEQEEFLHTRFSKRSLLKERSEEEED